MKDANMKAQHRWASLCALAPPKCTGPVYWVEGAHTATGTHE